MLDYVLVVAVGISAGIGAIGLGCARPAALYPVALPGGSDIDHPGQPSRST